MCVIVFKINNPVGYESSIVNVELKLQKVGY